ncbi:unnamed protein product [Urochloa humidicola]
MEVEDHRHMVQLPALRFDEMSIWSVILRRSNHYCFSLSPYLLRNGLTWMSQHTLLYRSMVLHVRSISDLGRHAALYLRILLLIFGRLVARLKYVDSCDYIPFSI